MSYVTVDDKRTFGVVFPILKRRQLLIHCSDSEWSFVTKQISVTRITRAVMAVRKGKWDLIIET